MAINQVKPHSSAPTFASEKANESGRSEKVSARHAANSYSKSPLPPASQDAAAVQISPKARELSMARRVVDSTPDVREDKVAKFKELIAQGKYKPDSGKIADGIVHEAIRDELSKTPDVALED